MIEGYDNRMLTAPRFVREGNRLIPESALVRVPTKAKERWLSPENLAAHSATDREGGE